mgnify:CR=1 FL=1
MLAFAAAVFFLIVTPGPGVLTTAGVGTGYGWSAGLRFLAGLFVGTNLVGLAVVSGLWAAVAAAPGLREGLFAVSLLYLLYLAARIAFAGARVAFIETRKAPGPLGGLMLQLVNPKAYAVNTTLLTGFAFMPEALSWELAIKFLIMNLIWVPIHLGWLWAGVSLHRLNLRPEVQSRVNMAMAASMLAVVGIAAWSQLA